MSFQDRAINGDFVGVVKMATINGALWAIGTSWSNSIREISRLLFPKDTMDAVLAEVIATVITTFIGIGVALLAGRTWCVYGQRHEPVAAVPPVKSAVVADKYRI